MTQRVDLMAAIWPLSRALRRIEDDVAGEYDMTMWQYAILNAVVRRPGLTQAAVADRIGYSRNRIVGDLDALEAAGLLQRGRGADRRAHALEPTAAGKRRAATIQRGIHRREDELLSPLSVKEQAALRSALGSWLATVRDD